MPVLLCFKRTRSPILIELRWVCSHSSASSFIRFKWLEVVAKSKFLTFLLPFLAPVFSETMEWTCFEFTPDRNLHKDFAHKRIGYPKRSPTDPNLNNYFRKQKNFSCKRGLFCRVCQIVVLQVNVANGNKILDDKSNKR